MGVLEHKARARLFYKYLSRVYDRVNPFIWTEEMRTDALGLLDLEPEMTVLDVGCGTGFATDGLLEHVDEVYALDQSEHQLEQAYAKFGKRAPPVTFHRGDAERLPFATDTFDVVWSSGSIEYWPNPILALREFRRVLKPGGQVLVVGPNYPDSFLARKLADSIMLFTTSTRPIGCSNAPASRRSNTPFWAPPTIRTLRSRRSAARRSDLGA